MERIDAAFGIGTVFIYTGLDPFGAVAGNKLYRNSLLLCQLLEEQGEDTFSMSFVNPDDLAGIMVHNDSDMFVTLA